MLKRFEVSNFKNFKETIVIDFAKVGGYHFNQNCITDDTISKMLIYGRNATGKTNLGRALMDIAYVVSGDERLERGMFTNADADSCDAVFKYIFQFDYNEVIYRYSRLNENTILDEELLINNEQAFYFNYEKKMGYFNNLEIINADTLIIKRFLERLENNNVIEGEGTPRSLAFLRWLISNTAFEENSILLRINDYIKRMGMISVGTNILLRSGSYYRTIAKLLDENNSLKDFEDFLNAMGIECKLEIKKMPEGSKELYFVHKKPVLFSEAASSGTLAIMAIYSRFVMNREASLLYIDEFDAFYHYEMSENVVQFFKERFPNTQIIMTTHNTNLMANSLMRPDCLFILSRHGQLTALCDATPRELREGHNLEKLYISGEFEDYE